VTAPAVLTAHGIVKRFGDLHVLRGMDLEMRAGEVYGLLGANGSGKTTALNIIAGLLSPDGGQIGFGGSESTTGPTVLGVAPQDAALYPRLTSAENLVFFAGLYGLRGDALQARVARVIEVTRLSERRDAPAAILSGGFRRRLNLAIAMVHGPDLLILDEPTAGLDIEARYGVWSIIERLRDDGIAVLLTTHLLDEAAALCSRIGLLHAGHIVREGTVPQLCACVPANLVAEVESDDREALLARVDALGLPQFSRGGHFDLWLAQDASLEDVTASLRDTGLRSVRLRPVGLQDVFMHVAGESMMPSPGIAPGSVPAD
jgi:ABC-2 type transport system ATP-binding protein